ncbi:M48 family metalloprotease [Salinispirillum sp. LH 10-3-1]|uniref:M48 family metalloprotease n=1 Tax=Salinispirillum sp. LH 10-3-1 TaxID=2952525 RepID=A0AB38YDA9_9GAMM
MKLLTLLSRPELPLVSRSHRKVLIACLTTVLLAGTLRADTFVSDLPSLGQKDIRTQTEEAISGLRYLRFLNRESIATQDPALTYYLQQSTAPLLPFFATEQRPSELMIFGVNNRNFNAFALPGGLIGVHTGMMDQMTETAELQAIIAHELGHLALGHHARLAGARRDAMGMVIASFLLIPLAAQVDASLAAGVFYGAQGLAMQQQLAFSRSMEEEADRAAVNAMRSSGLPLQGIIDAYESMARYQRSQVGTVNSTYPGTHPDVVSRLADLRNRIAEINAPAPQADLSIPLCWVQTDFSLTVRSTTNACTQYKTRTELERQDQQRFWLDMLANHPANPYLIYRANEWLRRHAAADVDQLLRQRLMEQSRLLTDSWLVALSVLSSELYDHPADRERWIRSLYHSAPPNDLAAWAVLSQEFNLADRRALAFRAEAQSSWIKGEVAMAVRQLQRAIELTEIASERSAWQPILRRWEALLPG